MNVQEICSLVDKGIDRDDIYETRLFVQQAQTQLMRDYSFTWMTQSSPLIQAANTDYVSLPIDFKEFVRGGRGPVRVVDPIYGWITCDLVEEGRFIRSGIPGFVVFPQFRFRVWLEWGANAAITGEPAGTVARLRTYLPIDVGALNYEISYYRFLTVASADSDTNIMLTNHNSAVIQKAKALAYESVGDEKSEAHDKLYRRYLEQDRQRDAYQRLAGKTLRM